MIRRSPLFYVGDKYKLMEQLLKYFPVEVGTFFEPFTGGGTVFLNINAKKYVLNDLDKNLIKIHRLLVKSSKNPQLFYSEILRVISKYGLSRSYLRDIVPQSLKKQWPKTYYARFNKVGYDKLRVRVNKNINNDPLILYILLIYGFNRMLRFNGGGKFNLPVGNVDFNKNVVRSLDMYFDFVRNKEITFNTFDFRKFIKLQQYKKNDFIYLDPPYLITGSEYNKYWHLEAELDLLKEIDWLDKKGVKFALSNVTHYKGKKNEVLIRWMKKYSVHGIKSNYINYHNNKQKDIREVLVTNYNI